jgi:uncharacterized HhH-GPD family protein
MAKPKAIHFTGNPEADELLADDPFALLVGFALDQQVTVPTAFLGPLKLKQRLGHLDPKRIAALPPDELEAAFRQTPAVHRFPGNMAKRVQELAATIAEDYDGHADELWTTAGDATQLEARIRALPGFGDMKVVGLGSTLAKRFDVKVAAPLIPDHPCLGDVDSTEALEAYQSAKRAAKKARREAASTP